MVIESIILAVIGIIVAWWVTKYYYTRGLTNINFVESKLEGQVDEKPTKLILINNGNIPLDNLDVSAKVTIDGKEHHLFEKTIPRLRVSQPTIIVIQKDLNKLFKELELIFFGNTSIDTENDIHIWEIAVPNDKLFFEISVEVSLSDNKKNRIVEIHKLEWTSWNEYTIYEPAYEYYWNSRISQRDGKS